MASKSSKSKNKPKKSVKAVAKKVVKKVKAKVKKSMKAGSKPAASQDLKKEVMDWIKANPGKDVARAAVEKFDVTYDHLKDWVMKEGGQVKEAVEQLIKKAPTKKDLEKKSREKIKDLTKVVQKKKSELKNLAAKLKAARA